MHAACEDDAAYELAKQLVQVEDPAALKLPAAQEPVHATAIVVAPAIIP